MRATLRLLRVGLAAADVAHRVFSLLPGYSRVVDLATDTILGPADAFEYKSTTANRTPPPYSP